MHWSYMDEFLIRVFLYFILISLETCYSTIHQPHNLHVTFFYGS